MRDVVFTMLVIGALPFCVRFPWFGIMMWTWISVMSPHRLTWGFAWNQPWAMLVAIAIFLGVVFSTDRKDFRFPVTPITVLLVLMPLWFTVTTLFALEASAWYMWNKVSKIFLMLLVTLYVLHSRRHIELLVWVTVGSIAFYGTKGGLFTLRIGGGEKVWGPGGSFIEDNNALAVAVIMCIPLLNYIRMTVKRYWVKLGMLASMVLCGFSVIGSHSRGAFLGAAAMGLVLWWRGKSKVLGLVAIGGMALGLLAFAPDVWEERMETIRTYDTDGSAQGRLHAWSMALNLVKDRPIVGGGFDLYSASAFARWAPDSKSVHASHSIYFQMLGEHGFPGFFMYMLLGILSWRLAAWIRRTARGQPDYEWAYWLASMCQVSFVGFAVAGAFQNLGYWDVTYNLIIALVLTRLLMEKEMVKISVPSARPVRDAAGTLIREPGRAGATARVMRS